MRIEVAPSPCRFHVLLAAAVLTGLLGAAPAHAEAFYEWSGNGGGNNWSGSSNWRGASGVPDAVDHHVTFPNNSGHHNVDLNNGDWDVGGITFDNTSNTYRVKSSRPGSGAVYGNLRNSGDLTSTSGGYVYFQDGAHYYQRNAGTWNLHPNPQYMVFDGDIHGSSSITLNGGVTLNNANSYLGALTVANGGTVRFGIAGALQSAHVILNQDDGLDVKTNSINASIRTLAGSGDLDIGSTTFTVTSAQQKTFSGAITGSSSPGGGAYGTFVVGGTSTNNTYTLNGDISGIDTLKTTGCTLILDGNTVTLDTQSPDGGIILGGGAVDIVNGADVTVQNDGNVDVGAQTLTIDGATLTTATLTSSGGVVDLTNPSTGIALTIDMPGSTSQNASFGGFLTGAGSLRKTGAGSWRLTKANTFSGDALISAGRLILGHNNALQNATVLIINNDGLDVNDRPAPRLGALGGPGNLDIGASPLTVGANNATTDYSGILSGSGTLDKVGSGSWTLSGANSFSGAVNINDGKVIPGNADALHNATVRINRHNGLDVTTEPIDANLGGLAGSGNLNIGSQTVRVGSSDADTIYSGALSGDGTFIKQYASALTLDGGSSILGAMFHFGSGDLDIRGGTLELTGEIGNTFYLRSTTTTRIEDGAVVTLTGPGGSNRTVLTNNAELWVQDAGSRVVTPRLDVGPDGAGSAYVNVLEGAVIDAERIQVGDLASDHGAAGTLSVHTDGAVHADEIVLYRRGTIDVYGNGTLETDTLIDGDTEPHSIRISDFTAGPALTVGINDGNSIVDALIEDSVAGPGSIRKVGAGTLELRNANTYSAGTAIDGGTLLAGNASGSATGSGDVTVSAGGTLGGSGSVAGMTIVESGGTVSPGASIGTLTLEDASFDTGSSLAIEIGDAGDHDQLVVTGTAALGGTIDLSYLGEFIASPGDSFTVLSAAALTGTFDTVNLPDGRTWVITYGAGSVTVGVCADSDSDGVCDDADICLGFDDGIDADGDGIPNGCDACAGFDDAIDTDADGLPDGCDGCPTSPNVHNATQDVYHATIQAALEAAQDGDVIELGACTFYEDNITVQNGVDLTLRGAGMDQTLIDGGSDDTDPVIRIDDAAVTLETTVSDFSITNSNGPAIEVVTGSPGLRSIRFQHCTGASPLRFDAPAWVDRCVFTGNSGAFESAYFGGNAALLTHCLFHDNDTTGAITVAAVNGSVLAQNCTVLRAAGGTITVHDSAVFGAINCILGDGFDVAGGGSFEATRCLYPGATGDNISGVATFVDAANGDYRLAAGSLGIDAADHDAYEFYSGGSPTDLNGDPRTHDDLGIDDTGLGDATYLDVGAFEFQGTTACGAGGDFGDDGDVDLADYGRFAGCMSGPSSGLDSNCGCFDLDNDGDVDSLDFAEFQISFTATP